MGAIFQEGLGCQSVPCLRAQRGWEAATLQGFQVLGPTQGVGALQPDLEEHKDTISLASVSCSAHWGDDGLFWIFLNTLYYLLFHPFVAMDLLAMIEGGVGWVQLSYEVSLEAQYRP